MESQNKSVAFQWIVPSVVLMVVVLIMLFDFSSKSSKEASELVYKDLISKTENYADNLYTELRRMHSVAAPMAELLKRNGVADTKYVQQILEITAQCSEAHQVLYCDLEGNGYNENGEKIAIGDKTFFETVLTQTDCPYVFAGAQDDIPQQDCIVAATKVEGEKEQGYLLLFYSTHEFANVLSASDADASGQLMLLDTEGKVLALSGFGKTTKVGMNIIDQVAERGPESSRIIKNRLKNGTRGTTEVLIGDNTRILSYAPFGINGWEMMMSVSKSYVDRQVEQQWKNTKQMLVQLMVVIFVFVCIIMIVNIIAKISSNEKKKQLEDKADTDLLTGLNNKLATERKIKQYMAQHPDSQSMMFLLDIDNFKKINDTMGHAFGDEVLRSLGQQIGSNFRATDIIGRIGGDEFMIFLKGIEEPETIRKEAKKIENFFKGFQAGEYVKYAATASIGVAIFPQEGADFETLYKAADQGLYKAKKRGKNQLAFYRDEWVQELSDTK